MDIKGDVLLDLLNAWASKGDEDDDDNKPTVEEQEAELQEFLKQDITAFRVGDHIKRNKFGRQRYKMPREDQLAVITHIYKDEQVEYAGHYGSGRFGMNAQIVHAEMAIVSEKSKKAPNGVLQYYAIDLRFYEKI